MGISGGSNSITLPFLLIRSVPSLRLPVRRAPVSRLSRSGSADGAHADFSRCGDQSVKLRREASKLDRPKRYQCELPLPATGQAKGDRRSCRRQFHFQQPLTPAPNTALFGGGRRARPDQLPEPFSWQQNWDRRRKWQTRDAVSRLLLLVYFRAPARIVKRGSLRTGSKLKPGLGT